MSQHAVGLDGDSGREVASWTSQPYEGCRIKAPVARDV